MAVKNVNSLTLTGADVVTATEVGGLYRHAWQVQTKNIDTNITCRIKGSIDNVSFFTVPIYGASAVTGLTFTNNVATITANSTFILRAEAALSTICFDVVTAAQTTATCTASYMGLS